MFRQIQRTCHLQNLFLKAHEQRLFLKTGFVRLIDFYILK